MGAVEIIEAGAGAGAAGAQMLTTGYDIWNANRNRKYNIKQNELTRQREDNAVQRRVLDLKRAGLHPTLAAGGAASAQNVTPTSPVQFGDAVGDIARSAKATQESANLRAQNDNLLSQNELLEAQTDKTKEEALSASMDNYDKAHYMGNYGEQDRAIRFATKALAANAQDMANQLTKRFGIDSEKARLAAQQVSTNVQREEYKYMRKHGAHMPHSTAMQDTIQIMDKLGIDDPKHQAAAHLAGEALQTVVPIIGRGLTKGKPPQTTKVFNTTYNPPGRARGSVYSQRPEFIPGTPQNTARLNRGKDFLTSTEKDFQKWSKKVRKK